jgi:murein DD-endopeptidase MepM/ murein hydrolase activator NlpD
VATNSIENVLSAHRRAITPQWPVMAQRYAVDWVKYHPNRRLYTGVGSSNADWAGWGEPILATHDGTVVDVLNTLPDNTPFQPPVIVINATTVLGNHVILDIGGGLYSIFAHMQHGTVRVNLGDHVKEGQVLGLLGNTGNSGAPHLHHHISTCLDFINCADWPYVLSAYTLLVTLPRHPLDMPGVEWLGPSAVTPAVTRAHPYNGDVVQFSSASTVGSSSFSLVVCSTLRVLLGL